MKAMCNRRIYLCQFRWFKYQFNVNSGDVEDGFDEFIVLDSDGTEIYNRLWKRR